MWWYPSSGLKLQAWQGPNQQKNSDTSYLTRFLSYTWSPTDMYCRLVYLRIASYPIHLSRTDDPRFKVRTDNHLDAWQLANVWLLRWHLVYTCQHRITTPGSKMPINTRLVLEKKVSSKKHIHMISILFTLSPDTYFYVEGGSTDIYLAFTLTLQDRGRTHLLSSARMLPSYLDHLDRCRT